MISRRDAESALRAAVRAGEPEDALVALEALELAEHSDAVGGIDDDPAASARAAALEDEFRERGLA